jgi:hypothetical protein
MSVRSTGRRWVCVVVAVELKRGGPGFEEAVELGGGVVLDCARRFAFRRRGGRRWRGWRIVLWPGEDDGRAARR